MNEAETRAEYIDPKLKSSGWGDIDYSKVLREFHITDGKIQVGAKRNKPEIADYILVYKNVKIGVIEAKRDELEVGEGVAQAKSYAEKLHIDYTYSTNGKEIYEICLSTGKEKIVDNFPTPEELWNKTFHSTSSGQVSDQNEWKEKFANQPFEDIGGTKRPRYYQELAVNKTLDAVAEEKDRILLTLATGTGKTFIAFQIAWKLFHTRWNLKRDGSRRPRILFLADRNILADQAFNSFLSFNEDALVRINPLDIRKKGAVPMSGSIYFTIFQTFMSGASTSSATENSECYFGEYPPDFFDFIIIDECHRGGANDEGNWRGILEYFAPAVQLGLTATPKRKGNTDTYEYFGEPVYIYSLKEGINDGFLTPFKVKRIQTTLDDYIYTSDDQIIEGEIEEGKVYEEGDFNRIIEIKEREEARVKIIMDEINQNEKTIIFCATQVHAAAVRDLANQYSKSKNINYCVRVTANDGARGEQFLRDFQDNEKTIPTILTTSQKLSTGVDARNVRNIVLMRPVNSMIEFKQIVGRGTRVFDGKEYFTIYDFVEAYKHFSDPEWDGEPIEPEPCSKCEQYPCICEKMTLKPCKICGQIPCVCPKEPPQVCPKCEKNPCECIKKVKIKLRDGKTREIQHMISTSFWSTDGKPISVEEFIKNLYGAMPDFFRTEEELREIWSNPTTRKAFLDKIAKIGFGEEELRTVQKMIDAENSDLFDVLNYISFCNPTVSRSERISKAKIAIFENLNEEQVEFLNFVLSKYEEKGVDELFEEKLPVLLNIKYHAIANAEKNLGSVDKIRSIFFGFQKKLYIKTAV